MESHGIYDVAIAGGGFSGLSAAVALARSRRSVVVVDGGEPRNAPAAGAHNVLGREGVPPLELLAEGRREAQGYGARLEHGQAVSASLGEGGFELGLADGRTIRARRLLLATGLVDELPEVPGVRELWGRSVLHCPYCHGWEVRGRRIGVLATDARAVHQALLFRQLSEDVTVFLHEADLDDAARAQLAALGIRLVEGRVAGLTSEGGGLRAVALADGREVAADAVVVAPRFVARTALYEQLGGTPAQHPLGVHIPADAMGKTDVPGVWAAGNSSDLAAMVSGASAAASLNADLLMGAAAPPASPLAARLGTGAGS
ncbi:NAD(P)/FAD-dependent oxidoreductase [Sinomonas mesophila]|uniref:NAD(P)/FAD-dependent oxidoreductase n=1 Tax=Sinomonas mesophila TaxID=1531955 RepID=UPI0011157431|nr:NAD(P)/FAD-dependent oxidoreductase [Sinomonas mesophila]